MKTPTTPPTKNEENDEISATSVKAGNLPADRQLIDKNGKIWPARPLQRRGRAAAPKITVIPPQIRGKAKEAKKPLEF